MTLTLPAKRGSLRVATLNLWGRFSDWPRRRELLRAELPPLDIDVYLLQEVVCGDGRGDQLEEAADVLAYGWTARVIAETRPHETEDEGVAIVSRLPLHSSAVWPLPPSHPPRHRLEASVGFMGTSVRLATFHAAVNAGDGRDEQIETISSIKSEALILGADLNARPSLVRRLVDEGVHDTLSWDEAPTWPVDEDELVRAWCEKLGEPPERDLKPARLDYVLYRGLEVAASGTLVLRDKRGSASDHHLVWADVRPVTG